VRGVFTFPERFVCLFGFSTARTPLSFFGVPTSARNFIYSSRNGGVLYIPGLSKEAITPFANSAGKPFWSRSTRRLPIPLPSSAPCYVANTTAVRECYAHARDAAVVYRKRDDDCVPGDDRDPSKRVRSRTRAAASKGGLTAVRGHLLSRNRQHTRALENSEPFRKLRGPRRKPTTVHNNTVNITRSGTTIGVVFLFDLAVCRTGEHSGRDKSLLRSSRALRFIE